MTTWLDPIAYRDGPPCDLDHVPATGIALALRLSMGCHVVPRRDGSLLVDRAVVLRREGSVWRASWCPPWDVAGWTARATSVRGALLALCDVLDVARVPGRLRCRDALVRVLRRAGGPPSVTRRGAR